MPIGASSVTVTVLQRRIPSNRMLFSVTHFYSSVYGNAEVKLRAGGLLERGYETVALSTCQSQLSINHAGRSSGIVMYG